MGFSTDSSVNKNLNDLIRDGYVTEGPPFALTDSGMKAVRFTSFPDLLAGLLIGVGILDLLISLEGTVGPIAKAGYEATFGLGVAVVALGIIAYRQKRKVFDAYLGLRKGLSPRESTPRELEDSDSSG